MFTKNWYKVAASVFTREKFTFTTISGGSYIVSLTTSTPLSYGYSTDAYDCPSLHHVRTSYLSYGGVVFGTGTTPPTIDDYCLSGDLLTAISCITAVSNAGDDGGMTTTAVYTVTNTSSEDITIGEIGLIMSVKGSTNDSTYKALIERTVLDAPITIPVGGVGQVTYTIRLNYPSA